MLTAGDEERLLLLLEEDDEYLLNREDDRLLDRPKGRRRYVEYDKELMDLLLLLLRLLRLLPDDDDVLDLDRERTDTRLYGIGLFLALQNIKKCPTSVK